MQIAKRISDLAKRHQVFTRTHFFQSLKGVIAAAGDTCGHLAFGRVSLKRATVIRSNAKETGSCGGWSASACSWWSSVSARCRVSTTAGSSSEKTALFERRCWKSCVRCPFDIELDFEAGCCELRGPEPRGHGRDGGVVLSMEQKHGHAVARGRNRLRGKQAGERDQRTDLPPSRGNGVERDDGALRDADEGDPLMGVREPFAPDDVVHKSVECISGAFYTLRIEGLPCVLNH